MPRAVAGLRADQARLRERTRGLGVGCELIAQEFARWYELAPRVAWRQAYGWSLSQATSQINAAAGALGLDRDGPRRNSRPAHSGISGSWGLPPGAASHRRADCPGLLGVQAARQLSGEIGESTVDSLRQATAR